MQRIRAKFQVQMVGKTSWGTEKVDASAVYGGSEENESFAAATPSGSLELYVDNPAAQGFFQPGDQFYVTMEKAE